MFIKENITGLIGSTPMVSLTQITSKYGADIFAKLESRNPGGSIKDRVALKMIEVAEKKKLINEDTILIEPTSGNMGIGIAVVGAAKGYKVAVVMPENMSKERIGLLKILGADVILTPEVSGMEGAIRKSKQIVQENPKYFMLGQFVNMANPAAHKETTAPEILKQMDNDIDAVVIGVGTGGTLTGIGEVLKSKNPDTQIIAVEPANSPVLSGGNPGKHNLQGIGAGFVPEVLNTKIIDRVIKVTDQQAFDTTRLLAKKEGILAGISSGAALFAAILLSEELGKGKKIVVIFPDSAERYLSTGLFS